MSITDSITQRFAAPRDTDPLSGLRLRAGTLADYGQLASYHYLTHRPVTACRVWVFEHDQATIVGRFAGRDRQPRVAAVLVESLPALSCALRNVALGDRYSRWANRGDAARLLNAELRCISRVIVHPQWRGLGLAVRLVRHALANANTPYVEALAAMGRVHPFFKQAGMTEYRRWPLPRDQRLLDALAHAGLEPWSLAATSHVSAVLDQPTPAARLLGDELARWAGRRLPREEQLTKARDQLLREPIYYLYKSEA